MGISKTEFHERLNKYSVERMEREAEIEALKAELAAAKHDLERERIWAIPQVGDPKLVVGLMQQAKDELAAAHAEVERLRADNRRHKDAVLALTKRCEEARKIIESLKELDYQTAGTPNYVLEEWLEGKP